MYKKSSAVARSMLATELSSVATSMFDDRVTWELHRSRTYNLKTELAVHLGVKKDAYFLNGCVIIWVVSWPGVSNALIQDYLNAFRAHVRRYQETEDVFLLFDRYIDGSTKEVTRLVRDKGATSAASN